MQFTKVQSIVKDGINKFPFLNWETNRRVKASFEVEIPTRTKTAIVKGNRDPGKSRKTRPNGSTRQQVYRFSTLLLNDPANEKKRVEGLDNKAA